MNQLKNGVYLEGNKYIAYADGEQVYSARLENRCIEQLNRVLRKRNKHESVLPVPAPPKAAPKAVAAPAPAYIMPAVTAENFIPTKDPNFVPFGEFKEVDTIIRSGMFFPIFITGPTGNGKSTMVEQACARNARAFIRLQISPHSDEDQLIGSKTLVDGNIEIVEGPVLIAMRTGAVLLLDECLHESERVRVGTIDSWVPVALSEMEIGKEYPVVSFNMDTGEFENDQGTLISDREDEIYEVELDDGSTILLNSKHPFIVNSGGVFEQKSIEDGLQIGDCIVKM